LAGRSERQAEQRLLEQVLRPDRGVVGRDETLVALQQGRLHQVLAIEKFPEPAGRCAQCGYVTATPATCPSCRLPTEPADLGSLLGELAHRYGASFEQVRDKAGSALQERGGLGGLLRW
ncbi:MAG: hypothetical protein HY335_11095, partial [Deinococcus sp.]|nr:hypothetical protein [Deinococcus sp.]